MHTVRAAVAGYLALRRGWGCTRRHAGIGLGAFVSCLAPQGAANDLLAQQLRADAHADLPWMQSLEFSQRTVISRIAFPEDHQLHPFRQERGSGPDHPWQQPRGTFMLDPAISPHPIDCDGGS